MKLQIKTEFGRGGGRAVGFEMEILSEMAVMVPDKRYFSCNSTNCFCFVFLKCFFFDSGPVYPFCITKTS